MPAPVLIQCPNCETRLKLKGQPSPGKKFRCRACRVVFRADGSEVDEVNEYDVDWEDDAAEASSRQRPTTLARNRTRRRLKVNGKWVAASIAAIVIVVAIFLVPWGKVASVANRINPLADSHESLLDSYFGEFEKAKAILEEYDKNHKADEAAAALEKVNERLDDIFLRAQRLPPLTPDEAMELGKSHLEKGKPILKWLGNDLINRHVEVGNPLFGPLISLKGSNITVFSAVLYAEDLREPTNPGDKTELEMLELLRDSLHSVSRINSSWDMASVAAELEENAQKLKELDSRLQAQIEASEASKPSPYARIRQGMMKKIEMSAGIVKGRYDGDKRLDEAIARFNDSDPAVVDPIDVAWNNRKPEFNGRSVTPKGVPNVAPPDEVEKAEAEANNANPDRVRPGARRGRGRDAAEAPGMSPWDAYQQLKFQHGHDNVVCVTFPLDLPYAEKKRLADGMTKIIGRPPADANIDMMFVYLTDELLNDICPKIDFAKVTNVVYSERSISLQPYGPGENAENTRYRPIAGMERRIPRGTVEGVPKRKLRVRAPDNNAPENDGGGNAARQAPQAQMQPPQPDVQMGFAEAIRTFGRDKFLIVDLPSMLEEAERQKLIAELKSVFGNARMANIDAGMVIFQSDVRPNELATRIKSAQVLGTDAAGRRITLGTLK